MKPFSGFATYRFNYRTQTMYSGEEWVTHLGLHYDAVVKLSKFSLSLLKVIQMKIGVHIRWKVFDIANNVTRKMYFKGHDE